MEKIKMMKKLLIILLCLPMMFSSCKKEENEPNNNLNNTTNNTDSITVLPPSQTFPFDFITALWDTVTDSNGNQQMKRQGYDIIKAEFEINCSGLTNLSNDVSYAFVTEGENYTYYSADTAHKIPLAWGNGTFLFYPPPGGNPQLPDSNGVMVPSIGRLLTSVYPINSNNKPAHAVFQQENKWLTFYIIEYYYSPGILTLYLKKDSCTGGDPNGWEIDPNYPDYWVVDMDVTEYSDGRIKLTIDQGPFNSSEGITWNSFLELTLEKNF